MIAYDKTDAKSIETYAKRLVGHTFSDVIKWAEVSSDYTYNKKSRKGGLGNLIEECYFGYAANGRSEADFSEAGVELKVTPIETRKKGQYAAGERLVLTMISYKEPITHDFENSHMWQKSQLLLIVCYLRDRSLKDNLLYEIQYASLFTPPEKDLVIIRNDYEIIVSKIEKGLAQELSESDTMYLGACTKGATAATSFVSQFYPPYIPAKRRAYCYKQSYMTYVINTYIAQKSKEQEAIIENPEVLRKTSFERYLIEYKLAPFVGKTDKELCHILNREYNDNKAQWIDLTYRMLGIKSNSAEEFVKANIVVKTIRIESDGKIRENMSFPAFKYKEIIKENWDDCELHQYFSETKFLFAVFEKDGDCYRFKGAKLWNMPYKDLEETVRQGWQRTIDTIRKGPKLTPKMQKDGYVVLNDFLKESDDIIIHVRPHTKKSYYLFPDGTHYGNGTLANANELPDGRWMTTMSFWLNSSYVLKQLQSLD